MRDTKQTTHPGTPVTPRHHHTGSRRNYDPYAPHGGYVRDYEPYPPPPEYAYGPPGSDYAGYGGEPSRSGYGPDRPPTPPSPSDRSDSPPPDKASQQGEPRREFSGVGDWYHVTQTECRNPGLKLVLQRWDAFLLGDFVLRLVRNGLKVPCDGTALKLELLKEENSQLCASYCPKLVAVLFSQCARTLVVINNGHVGRTQIFHITEPTSCSTNQKDDFFF